MFCGDRGSDFDGGAGAFFVLKTEKKKAERRTPLCRCILDGLRYRTNSNSKS